MEMEGSSSEGLCATGEEAETQEEAEEEAEGEEEKQRKEEYGCIGFHGWRYDEDAKRVASVSIRTAKLG